YRNGELIDHKAKADEAIAAAREEGTEVEKVLVWRRLPGEYHSQSPMVEGRDYFIDELLEDYRGQQVEPESMPAEAPLSLWTLSGRRTAVADRREARGEHLPHRADHDQNAAQARTGRAGEVQLPLQDDDDGRRADRARRLAVVSQGRRQGRGRDHGHVVADRER